jgi:hypothetical protein
MTLSKGVRAKQLERNAKLEHTEQFELGRRAGLIQAAEIAEKEDFELVRDRLPAVADAPMVIAAARGIVRATAMSIAGKIIQLSKAPAANPDWRNQM